MSEPIADDDREVALCPGCLMPVRPHDYFCEKCGLPLTSAATTLPMERIRSTGEMIRRGYERPKPIVLLGVWLIFGPVAVMLIPLILIFPARPPRTLHELPFAVISIVVPLAIELVLCAILWRTTSRFFAAQPESLGDHDDPKSEITPTEGESWEPPSSV